MRYYFLNYTDEIAFEFGGLASGPLIRIRPKYKGDVGLLEHEKTHVRQWYAVLAIGLLVCAVMALLVSPAFWTVSGVSPFLHQLLYRFVRPYRRWCEVRAYRKQIETGGYASNGFAVDALVEKYDLDLSIVEARALLTDCRPG